MNTGFTNFERKAISALSAIVGLRMVGLFLILPVLALHAHQLPGATPLLIGVSLGIYGLTQALLQLPYGLASDRWGRKSIISLGLIVFAIGSAIAATSDSIFGIILGRALQGGGAIAAAVLAFVGDLTRETQRNKAMAVVGVSIGSAFTLSLMLGPLLDRWIGVQGIFWVSFTLAILGLMLLWYVVPEQSKPKDAPVHEIEQGEIRAVLSDRNLIRLCLGSFSIHAVMTALFVALPPLLVESAGFDRAELWQIYVPILFLSFIGMVPLVRFSSRKNRSYMTMLIASAVLLAGHCGLLAGTQVTGILLLGLWLFFVGFNTLEALLPSITMKTAPQKMRGAAMGAFSTCTFAGAFVGGVVGGAVYGPFNSTGVFVFAGLVVVLWIMLAVSIRPVHS